jgi:hypothetical protein
VIADSMDKIGLRTPITVSESEGALRSARASSRDEV